jgi:hypothetical protein
METVVKNRRDLEVKFKYVYAPNDTFNNEKHYVQVKQGMSVTNFEFSSEKDANQAIWIIEKFANETFGR